MKILLTTIIITTLQFFCGSILADCAELNDKVTNIYFPEDFTKESAHLDFEGLTHYLGFWNRDFFVGYAWELRGKSFRSIQELPANTENSYGHIEIRFKGERCVCAAQGCIAIQERCSAIISRLCPPKNGVGF